MSQSNLNTVEIRSGEFEVLDDKLMKRSDGDKEVAGFFHCLGRAIGGAEVDSKYLRANTPDLKSR